LVVLIVIVFFFSSRRRHTRCLSDWSSDVCSSDLLCRMGLEHDFVKVLDFGIVKSRQPVTEGPQLATAADRIIGTPAFMPPEMARSEERRVGKGCRSRGWAADCKKNR